LPAKQISDVASVAVKAVFFFVVTNTNDGVAYNFVIINISTCGDLTSKYDMIIFNQRFNRYA